MNYPPYHKFKDNITYEESKNGNYKLRKQVRLKRVTIGRYHSYDLTLHLKEYLEKNNWDETIVQYIVNVTKSIQDRDKYIEHDNEKYYIYKTVKGKKENYGKYDNIEQARYVRQKLIENGWERKKIPEYLEKYDIEKEYTKYYYDTSDYLQEV